WSAISSISIWLSNVPPDHATPKPDGIFGKDRPLVDASKVPYRTQPGRVFGKHLWLAGEHDVVPVAEPYRCSAARRLRGRSRHARRSLSGCGDSACKSIWPRMIQAIGAPMYLDHAAREEASAAFIRYYNACRDVPNNNPYRCSEQASKQEDIVPRYRFLTDKANVALVALPPIVLGWLLAYALVYLGRWIRAGTTLSG